MLPPGISECRAQTPEECTRSPFQTAPAISRQMGTGWRLPSASACSQQAPTPAQTRASGLPSPLSPPALGFPSLLTGPPIGSGPVYTFLSATTFPALLRTMPFSTRMSCTLCLLTPTGSCLGASSVLHPANSPKAPGAQALGSFWTPHRPPGVSAHGTLTPRSPCPSLSVDRSDHIQAHPVHLIAHQLLWPQEE